MSRGSARARKNERCPALGGLDIVGSISGTNCRTYEVCCRGRRRGGGRLAVVGVANDMCSGDHLLGVCPCKHRVGALVFALAAS